MSIKLQEGSFKARPVQAIVGKTSTGKDQVEIVLAVYDGEQLSSVERSAYVYLSPAAFNRAIETLRTCGWTGDNLADVSMICEEKSPDVEMVLGEEEYNGHTKLKVKFVNPWRERVPLDPDALKSFGEMMRAKVHEADKANAERRGANGKEPF